MQIIIAKLQTEQINNMEKVLNSLMLNSVRFYLY